MSAQIASSHPTRRGEMNEFVYLDKWGVPFSDR